MLFNRILFDLFDQKSRQLRLEEENFRHQVIRFHLFENPGTTKFFSNPQLDFSTFQRKNFEFDEIFGASTSSKDSKDSNASKDSNGLIFYQKKITAEFSGRKIFILSNDKKAEDFAVICENGPECKKFHQMPYEIFPGGLKVFNYELKAENSKNSGNFFGILMNLKNLAKIFLIENSKNFKTVDFFLTWNFELEIGHENFFNLSLKNFRHVWQILKTDLIVEKCDETPRFPTVVKFEVPSDQSQNQFRHFR